MSYEVRAVWYDSENEATSVPMADWPTNPEKGEGWPDRYGVYHRREDGTLMHYADYWTAAEADQIAKDKTYAEAVRQEPVDSFEEQYQRARSGGWED